MWRSVFSFRHTAPKLTGDERERVAATLALVGLTGFERYYPHQLSGGMQQRVGLARALVRQPEILLMDEPFGALDAQTRAVLQDELLAIWDRVKSTVLFITHDLDEAIYLSDRVVIMSRRPGRIKQVLEVKLPRPRFSYDARAEPEFARLRPSPGRASRRSYEPILASARALEGRKTPGGAASLLAALGRSTAAMLVLSGIGFLAALASHQHERVAGDPAGAGRRVRRLHRAHRLGRAGERDPCHHLAVRHRSRLSASSSAR